MLLLSPNQQCPSTECKGKYFDSHFLLLSRGLPKWRMNCSSFTQLFKDIQQQQQKQQQQQQQQQ